MNKKLVLLALVAAIVCTAIGYAPRAKAVDYNVGYFYGRSEGGAWWNVWPTWGGSAGCSGSGGQAIPGSVRTADQFIAFTLCKLGGTTQEHLGAAFIISTMSGMWNDYPGPAEINEFAKRVRYAELQGWMNPDASDACSLPNTFYQSTRHDVAYEGDCATGGNEAITFWNGSSFYIIKRFCANPVGEMQPLQPEPTDRYDLEPSVTARVDGAVVNGGAEVGQTIQFTYSVRNSGPDPSPGDTSCTIYANVHSGYFAPRSNPPAGGGGGPPTGCPASLPANSTTPLGGTESVPVVAGNRTVCRSLIVSPATKDIPSRGFEACVPVVNKPYFKVYGGDLSAGNGLENAAGACAGNVNAAVIGWNRGAAGGYGGAGVQFAAVALGRIFETASAVGNVGPNRAAVPRGLAFAGNNLATGLYGGSFGSVPCTNDFFVEMPTGAASFSSLAAASTSGAYRWNGGGTLPLSGSVPAGRRITLYTSTDVFINNDITYAANWNSGTTPLLQVVTTGNIYIRNGVSRIDGVFIAQKSGASGGTIYTCTLGPSALAADGQLYNRCNNKLTINGAFIANQVQFLRTNGTRQQASASEAGSSANISEVFNYSPALWMGQPIGPVTGSPQYDSITSLPPIL